MVFLIIDFVIVFGYVVGLIVIVILVSWEKVGYIKDFIDYFLVGKVLFWWVVGVFLIVVNIFVEQIIGQFGQGYVVGFVIVVYEWQVVIVLLVVVKYFLLIFLECNVYMML